MQIIHFGNLSIHRDEESPEDQHIPTHGQTYAPFGSEDYNWKGPGASIINHPLCVHTSSLQHQTCVPPLDPSATGEFIWVQLPCSVQRLAARTDSACKLRRNVILPVSRFLRPPPVPRLQIWNHTHHMLHMLTQRTGMRPLGLTFQAHQGKKQNNKQKKPKKTPRNAPHLQSR